MVNAADQGCWLASAEIGPDVDVRVDDATLRPKGHENFLRLERHVLGQKAISLAQLYVQNTMLQPKATELTFWSASAMPSTNAACFPRLAAISVNKMETFVLGWEKNDPNEMWAFINVSKASLMASYTSIPAFMRPRQEWLDVDDTGYESGGGDVLILRVYAPGGMLELLLPEDNDTRVVDAARRLNLMLIRKGPTLQWRWHCFDLADQLVDQF